MRLLFLFVALMALSLSTRATPTSPTLGPEAANSGTPIQKSLAQPLSSGKGHAFLQGVQAFQNKEFSTAAAFFAQEAKRQPRNAAVVHNGALSEYQMGHLAKAAALWRRALKIDPWFSSARQALAWVHEQSPPKGLGFQEPTSGFDWWHQHVLTYIPLNLLLSTLWGVLLVAGVLSWRATLRRLAFWHTRQGLLVYVLCGVLLVFIGIKSYDLNLKRATLVGPDLNVQTAPDEGANTLFQARAGQQVVVQRYTEDWLLCAQNGRSLGWLARDSVLVH